MKIALFHDTTGGSKRALYEHTRGLHRRGHSIDLYCFTDTPEEEWDIRPYAHWVQRAPIRVLPAGRQAPRMWTLLPGLLIELVNYAIVSRASKRLARAVDSGGYDAAFTHQCRHTHTPPILNHLQLPSLHFCQEPSRRFFEAIISGDLDEPVDRLWPQKHIGLATLARLERRSLASATRVLVNSQYSREFVAHAYGLPGHVCYLGVDPESFCPSRQFRENIVLSVGALARVKGHGFVIRALALLPQPIRPRLVIVADRGTADAKGELSTLAHDLRVEVSILTRVSDNHLARLYNTAALLACAQVFEPFGFTPLEAMACETPVVAVAEGGFRETVVDGVTGYLTPRDVRTFAQRIAEIAQSPELQRRLGKAGRERIMDRWTWDHAVTRLERHLEAIAKAAIGP